MDAHTKLHILGKNGDLSLIIKKEINLDDKIPSLSPLERKLLNEYDLKKAFSPRSDSPTKR